MKFITVMGLVLQIAVSIKAQSEIDSLIDEILFDEYEDLEWIESLKIKHYLYLGAGYEDRILYAGRESGISGLSGFSAQFMYFHKSGFSLGAGGYGYDNIAPNYYSTVLFAGYSGKIKKISFFRWRSSFNRYLYTETENESTLKNSLNAGITLKKKHIGTRFDLGLAFGKEELATRMSWDFYGDVTLFRFKKYNKLDFEPELSFYFGDETNYDYEYGELTGQLYASETEEFGWMNTYIRLPLSLILGNFDLEVSYTWNIPRSLINEDLESTGSFGISLGYMFGI